MTTDSPTERMNQFFGSCEAEEYAAKLQLRSAPLITGDGRTRDGVAAQLHNQVARLHRMFQQAGDEQPIRSDVTDLDAVDWRQLEDLVMID